MSIGIKEKLALVRESERLNKKDFAEMTGVVYSTYVYYENGRNAPSAEVVMKIFQHPRLQKYALWFLTDQVAPESGQIAPVLAHSGQDATTSPHSDQKTG
ncbi:helix-turn-helix domain-containing protein [Aeromonas piscicola]|uniref:helix-turn-helix domain-containing protein n=1 Tax=Aeromonas piscicola TaxID=600645 RepID=UPI0005B2FEEB|nr:helix-turn-helix transcriptional regulator [Aeromonas piscicola]